MAKKTSARELSKLNAISLPGIQVKELLELESLFPDLRIHLCIIMFAVILIAQVRTTLSSAKPAIIQSLDSVNTYIRRLLSKHESVVYVSAAVAIRRTLVAHASDPDDSAILAAHKDLTENLSGPVTTKGGLSKALGSPEDLRAYRRGIMAQVTGNVQGTPVHSPRKIHMSIESIDPTNFLPLLPFPTEDLDMENIVSPVQKALMQDSTQEGIVFNDLPAVQLSNTSLESLLPIKRITPKLPDLSKIPKNLENLPAWKQAAIQQTKNFNTGT